MTDNDKANEKIAVSVYKLKCYLDKLSKRIEKNTVKDVS